MQSVHDLPPQHHDGARKAYSACGTGTARAHEAHPAMPALTKPKETP
jgi:hypothetical protein